MVYYWITTGLVSRISLFLELGCSLLYVGVCFPTVRRWYPLCAGVTHCAQGLPTVCWCSLLCTAVFYCAWMYPTVHGCFPLCASVPHCARVFPSVHRCSPLCMGIPYPFPTVRGFCTHCVGVSTVYRCSPLCAGFAHTAWVFPLCTGVPHCARVLDNMHEYSIITIRKF